jgi:tRNA pseudouridine(38-40) synthase
MPISANVKLPRFMMHFSYAGQAYAGVQMNPSAKIDSVQSVIERALYNFQPAKHPLRFGVSSRTDRGVHALHNTATFDWISPIDITTLIQPLNTYLEEKCEQVRVLRIHSISPQFHFRRHCLGRKYVYRLGFLAEHEFTNINTDIPFLKRKHRYILRDITPATYNLFEKDHITYIEPPYDLDAFRKGIEVFQVS